LINEENKRIAQFDVHLERGTESRGLRKIPVLHLDFNKPGYKEN